MGTRIENIESVIDMGYGLPSFSVTMFAEILDVSTSYLREVIHVHYGMSPNELIEVYRMRKASEFLQDNSIEVQSICTKVGYVNCKTFREVFKKYFGMPPGQFRESFMQQSNRQSPMPPLLPPLPAPFSKANTEEIAQNKK